MRKLTAADVTFTIEIEEDETPVRGNVMCTEEPELDKAEEDEVIRRLDNGEVEAWCGVVVTATWEFDGHEYTGEDALWGNTLTDDYTKETCVADNCMKEQALDDLNATLAKLYARLSAVAAHLEEAS